ncbi:DUF2274 domain-containing protein [Sphingosinicella soli]|uniref:DUF2274 domain-containing protein n=1 Tax=Sphingosinicella soli TaxID=333708 RepID=A0A7W7B2K0_9SPHN|nr:DUF2274 domain-containing protein [Sphingosinicella soli]MBB4632859.1 hypothetical protein [Sphingosinicella soli]
MADLALPKLPDRTPVKITIVITPELRQTLEDYAAVYQNAYGVDEPITELIPQMLTHFLSKDRAFNRARAGRVRS